MNWTIFRTFLVTLLWGMARLAHAGTVTYVYTDPQGTPLAEANASGTITATFDYKPYGSQALGSPKAAPGYTGHVNDPDTGFVYMQARYYDPVVGRFLSVDSVGPSPSHLFHFNRFNYADNNPTLNTDPDGRSPGSDDQSCMGNMQCVSNNDRGSFWRNVKNIFKRRSQSDQAKDLRTYYANLDAYDPITGKIVHVASLSDSDIIAFDKDHRQDLANGGWSISAGPLVDRTRMTTPEARALAKELGFRQVKRGWDTHGQAIFEKDGRYITPDTDRHSGGTWKELNRIGQRIATLDRNLNVIGK